MKKAFNDPRLELILFGFDVLTTSGEMSEEVFPNSDVFNPNT